MTDKALSSPESRAASRRSRRVFVTVLVLVGLYFAVTAGIRALVSSRMAAVEGRALPAFSLKDRSGKLWTPAELRGRKVLLNFFRSRCPSCLKEAPLLRQLAKELDPERVLLLSVMMDRVQAYPADLTERTLARVGYQHPVLMADQAFVDAFHGQRWAHVTPVTYVVDAKGQITRHLRGHQSLEALRAATQ